ncbi:ROK family protein [Microlunatus elymi]|uniref:ROK family protein n=1 Tax=Microlunatus elymi TaxID=2596828 RepID=A0A516PW23_9ACTN|nr:ROK family protein [Microlunatus elymi]QDP95384.1 ROK family protein [Microlunatus elymi]
MSPDAATVGIDIGGSKIAVGLVDDSGRVTDRAQVATPARYGGDAILDCAVRLVLALTGNRRIARVGVAAAGVIGANGVVESATDLLAGWVGTDLVGGLSDRLPGRPGVAAVNDVHAHAVGEAWRGAGTDREGVLLVAVGTGLGGAVVHGGRVLRGAHGAAGHLGHVRCVEARDLPCSCGATGHLEAIASGYGLVQLYHRLGGDPTVTDARQVSTRTVFDPEAAIAVERSASALGSGLGDLTNIIDPDLVVISGSVMGAGPSWWRVLRTAAREASLRLLTDTAIVPATLGADAGIIGAARIAQDHQRVER